VAGIGHSAGAACSTLPGASTHVEAIPIGYRRVRLFIRQLDGDMSQDHTAVLDECTTERRALEFPVALLEPPAWWDRSEYFDANNLDEVVEEMAYQLGRDGEHFEPEASFRRFNLHGNAGQFGIYVHQGGELLASGYVAIAVTPAPEPFIDYGPDYGPDDDAEHDPDDGADDQQVRAFVRLAGVFGIGPTADAAAADAVARLHLSRTSK
jgi:hypothetical protein